MAKKVKNPQILAALAKAEEEPGSVKFFVGLDVGLKSTAICVVDGDGEVISENTTKSDPTEIGRYLRKNYKSHITRIGIETGSISVWLTKGLRRQGFQVAMLDALKVHRILSIKRNKTDPNDARGIAEIVRSGRNYISEVYVKSSACFAIRAQLILRSRLVQQRLQNEMVIRGLLKVHGGRVEPGSKTSVTFSERVMEQVFQIRGAENIDLRPQIVPMLRLGETLYDEAKRIEQELEKIAAENPTCQRMMDVPGVGAIVALSFYTAIEDPTRFRRADDVAAYLGLTPRIYQSGESLTSGSISRMGNRMTRTHLVQAATVMLSGTKSWSSLKDWGIKLSKRVGFNKAKVAVARKLAIVLFSIWRDGTFFQSKADTVSGHRALMQKAQQRREATA